MPHPHLLLCGQEGAGIGVGDPWLRGSFLWQPKPQKAPTLPSHLLKSALPNRQLLLADYIQLDFYNY